MISDEWNKPPSHHFMAEELLSQKREGALLPASTYPLKHTFLINIANCIHVYKGQRIMNLTDIVSNTFE